MQRQDGLVTQGILKRVTAHIASFVLGGSECPKGVVLRLVDRCACQPKEESVGKGGTHTLSEVTLLGTVCLVDHHDDIVAAVDVGLGVFELEDGGDDDIA